MRILDAVANACFLTVKITLPFFLISWIYCIATWKWHHKLWMEIIRIASVLTFVSAILIAFCVGFYSRSIAEDEVIGRLNSLTNQVQVSVNGRTVPSSTEILSALRTLRWVMPHHSDPTKRIAVELFDGSNGLVLTLARDSNNPKEYWVFYPKYQITTSNEIGRVKTSVFDSY